MRYTLEIKEVKISDSNVYNINNYPEGNGIYKVNTPGYEAAAIAVIEGVTSCIFGFDKVIKPSECSTGVHQSNKEETVSKDFLLEIIAAASRAERLK